MPDPLKSATILVVEDQPLVRMHGVGILQDAGYTVLEACDADEALQMLEQNDGVSVLFSDLDMPGSMDGLELSRIVHQRWPEIGLLLTSGHHHLEEAMLADHERFVRKPWQPELLLAKIQTALPAPA